MAVRIAGPSRWSSRLLGQYLVLGVHYLCSGLRILRWWSSTTWYSSCSKYWRTSTFNRNSETDRIVQYCTSSADCRLQTPCRAQSARQNVTHRNTRGRQCSTRVPGYLEVPEYLLTKTFRRPKMENVPTLPILVTHAERFWRIVQYSTVKDDIIRQRHDCY